MMMNGTNDLNNIHVQQQPNINNTAPFKQFQQFDELQIEINDLREKNKIITQKFQACKKERDDLKKENKELQDQMAALQNQMRSMVPCTSNTSQSFPMFNELTNSVSEFYKCDCQDVFFDVLSSEMNLEGVVYFFQNSLPPVVQAIEKHFYPVEQQIKEASSTVKLDQSISNVLRKKYQSNWKQIFSQIISKKFCTNLMQKIQSVLLIADNESEETNNQIVEFIEKFGQIALQMMISDPPLLFDFKQIGQKVSFNQHKQDSLDGFIKSGQDCLVILPSVYKLVPSSHGQQTNQENNLKYESVQKQKLLSSTSIIGNLYHLKDQHYQKQVQSLDNLDRVIQINGEDTIELIQQINVLPTNYEFQ